MPDLRLHLIPETEDPAHPNACAALRLIDPYSSPAVSALADVTTGPTLPDIRLDVLVMQRLGRATGGPEALMNLVRTAKSRGIRLIYDLDDNLLDPHPDPASEAEIAPHRRSVHTLLRAADHVTVSTPALADRLRRLHPRITVLPNALDDRRLTPPPPREPGARLHLGYFGTFTHLTDLMSVAAPLRAALAQLDRPRLTLCGISTDPRLPALFAEVADVDTLPATADYQSFLNQMSARMDWDIGLAPLAAGPFEATKSDIKFLEYAAHGIPGLYSAHPAYTAVEPGTLGLVAPPHAWTQSLLTLARDPGLRRRIAAAAGMYLRAERLLTRRGTDWAALLRR